jgi:N-acetylglucosaminyl-diphospho-decaprenol L-rhamnosyltransferase
MKFQTTAILVSFKSNKIIENSIKKINNTAYIVIIENSKNRDLKQLEKKYKNLKVIFNKNSGFGTSANIGARLVKTRYILFISPDTFIEKNGIKKIENISKGFNNFGILLPTEDKYALKKNKNITKPIGSPLMFFEKNKFKKFGGFDEKYFLYYEDIDIQNRFIKKNQKVIKINVLFKHLYGSHDKKFNFEIEINRNWHYMWSRFYYIKKNHSFFYALICTLPTFLRSLIKLILYFLISKKEYFIYKARFLGLINSYCGKKSWYRPSIK